MAAMGSRWSPGSSDFLPFPQTMATEQGFAIRRNGSCLAGYEVDCGPTREPFRGCCPNGFECPSQYNIACCPPGKNCTTALLPEPKCANATWDLFDNGGYFCCEHGLPGYNNQNTNGCASPGFQFGGGEEALATVQAGQTFVPSSTASSASSSSTALATNTPSSSSSSTPVGPIVGGVVGGVAVIAILLIGPWYLLRRKRQKKQQNLYENSSLVSQGQHMAMMHQLDENQAVHEVDGGAVKYAHVRELPAEQEPSELPGHDGRS